LPKKKGGEPSFENKTFGIGPNPPSPPKNKTLWGRKRIPRTAGMWGAIIIRREHEFPMNRGGALSARKRKDGVIEKREKRTRPLR